MLNYSNMVEDVGFFEKNSIDEVVAFDASERNCEIEVFSLFEVGVVREETAGRHLPARPFLRGCTAEREHIFARQGERMVSGDESSLFLLIQGDVFAVRLKRIGENVAGSVLVEPPQFALYGT